MQTIDQLATLWQQYKDQEDAAREQRINIEKQILNLHPAREEGSETFETPAGHKVTLVGKLAYKVDVDQLVTLTGSWPAEIRPIKTEVKADETRLKAIRSNRPDLWEFISSAVETKPAKTGVSIKSGE